METIQLGDPNVRFATPEEALHARLLFEYPNNNETTQKRLDSDAIWFGLKYDSFEDWYVKQKKAGISLRLEVVTTLPAKYEREIKLGPCGETIYHFYEDKTGFHIY